MLIHHLRQHQRQQQQLHRPAPPFGDLHASTAKNAFAQILSTKLSSATLAILIGARTQLRQDTKLDRLRLHLTPLGKERHMKTEASWEDLRERLRLQAQVDWHITSVHLTARRQIQTILMRQQPEAQLLDSGRMITQAWPWLPV